MIYTALVDTETLASNLPSDWRLFDCRYVLNDPGEGERRYHAGHIPGALYLHLDRDMAGAVTPESGRHPLPNPESLTEKLRKAGVSHTSQIVAYDDAGGAFAARLWWLMRWLGHQQVAVLDGGIDKWIKENRPITQAASTRGRVPRGDFQPHPDDRRWVKSDYVAICVQQHSGRLLDARALSRFRGDEEPIDSVAGHVPGAVNLPFTGNVNSDSCFKSPRELRRRFETALEGIAPADSVCMCGSGVTACHNLLAMEVAGMHGARLYVGSWSEWIRNPSHPVERG
jgi:thiosulfate/3-mercaptopyruvate sulfurtransferase